MKFICLLLLCLSLFSASIAQQSSTPIGFYNGTFDSSGNILPHVAPLRAASLLVRFYQTACPLGRHGYPVFVTSTFLDADCRDRDNPQIIPGTHLGMGILSFLQYAQLLRAVSGSPLSAPIADLNPPALLNFSVSAALSMADYLLRQSLTPQTGVFAGIPRSSGINLDFPLRESAQADVAFGINTTEPDKAGIAGYALLRLAEFFASASAPDEQEAAEKAFGMAVHIARTLAQAMRNGTAQSSPWGFRVNSVTGEVYQRKSANMAFILRLFFALSQREDVGGEFQGPFRALWAWVAGYQIPSSLQESPSESLWVNFYEDILDLKETDRSSWAPLELARFLMEAQDRVDPDWQQHVAQLFSFALSNFAQQRPGNVTVLGEQDGDHKIWGGTCSKLASVAAMYSLVGGPAYFGVMAKNLLSYMTYFVDPQGVPSALLDTKSPQPLMGWQQDSLTDVLHNYAVAIDILE